MTQPLPLPWRELSAFVNGYPGYEGVPGVRSPEYPCELFNGLGYDGTGRCMSDGHYLCVECSELSPEAPRFTEPYATCGVSRRPRFAAALGRLDRIRALRATMRRRQEGPVI